MVERRMELRRRRHRQQKLRKLKKKLANAKTGGDRENFLHKILVLSPWWQDQSARKKG
jgi:hypothetical protein